MAPKAAIAFVRSLHQRKGRIAHGLFIVQGAVSVQELLRSGRPVQAVHATAEAAARLGLRDASTWPAHVLQRMGTLESGNEVVAVVPLPCHAPPARLAPDELVLALDGIADPGNLGTVVRIADWFGVRHVLCAQGSVDVFNPKAVQATMGGFLRVAVWGVVFGAYGEHWLLIGVTVSLALVGVVLWGSLTGSLLPIVLKRFGADPAASSTPFVATIVDVVGIVIFFALAKLVLTGTLL